MIKKLFTPADILLPEAALLPDWSVVACDQYSSERDYWERVSERVGEKPSTLHMILPEAYLSESDDCERIQGIYAAMNKYQQTEVFREIKDSFIYIERTLEDGRIRRGIIGALDLEQYDYAGNNAPAIASEGTVLDRIPARVRIRIGADLELTHIIAFIDDKYDRVINPITAKSSNLPLLYDFDLMENGGHIVGRQVTGTDAESVMSAILGLSGKPVMIIGDGNHSLAAAKFYWNDIKQGLTAGEQELHPARRVLVEINSVYDPAITFKAIHRVIFGGDPEIIVKELAASLPPGEDYTIQWCTRDKTGTIFSGGSCFGEMLSVMQDCLDDFIRYDGYSIDYIHGSESAKKLAEHPNTIAFLLPTMEKHDFFETIRTHGTFPRKSFSIGRAHDKRFYLECRKIR